MRFKKLVETILTEDIESMKKYYPNISDEAFQSYVELDPTYKEGSTQAGKYAKWILGLANKGKLDNIGHVKDVLSRFDEEKNNLKEKDIMKYKSVDEVEAMLNDENSYKALSDRQRLRQTQKAVHNTDLDQDAERLFNGKDWEVWVPHTYEASCKLGRGTSWCTASTESDHYFRSYTKSGKLYIIINKHNGEKYQFHFESASFMDAEDESIPIAKFLLDNRELNDYFYANLPDEVKEQIDDLKELADNDYVFVYHGDIPQKMKYVFRYIEKIIVERDITKIPDKEFHKLIGLKEVSLHDNITYIGESAFEDCENLEYINLPHNLEHLGDYAFDGCVRLKSIKINSELQMLPMFAFSYIDAKRVDVPGNVNVIGNGAFCNTNLQTVILNEGVQVISSHAFSGSDRLTNIKLPHSLNKIDSRAFRNCTSLHKIVIPKEVEYMGHRVFGNCPELTVYCEAEQQPIRWETDWNHRAEVVWGYKGEVTEDMTLTEGKNLEQTVTQYIDKYKKIIPAADDEMHRNQVMGIIEIDPTYKANSGTTGDYAIWLLNMAIKNGWDVLGTRQKCEPILIDFIDKKSLLRNKDINSYKTLDDLKQALDSVELSDRQKERRARSSFASTKHVLSTENWDVYAALNYNGALTLGKGTSWCTATSDSAAWYVRYVTDTWSDQNYSSVEVRSLESEHLSFEEAIDVSDLSPDTTIEDIYRDYSDRAVFSFCGDYGFFTNPNDEISVRDCDTLYVFINKENSHFKYQFCMSYDLAEYEDDLEYAITFCDASDKSVSFRNFLNSNPELNKFWTDVIGRRLSDLFYEEEEDEI